MTGVASETEAALAKATCYALMATAIVCGYHSATESHDDAVPDATRAAGSTSSMCAKSGQKSPDRIAVGQRISAPAIGYERGIGHDIHESYGGQSLISSSVVA